MSHDMYVLIYMNGLLVLNSLLIFDMFTDKNILDDSY